MVAVPTSKLIGDAGEYLVAYELSRLGAISVLTRDGSRGVDVLATKDGSKSMAFQVKASEGKNDPHKWAVGKKRPMASKSFYYVFANIGSDESIKPEFFVVPSKIVKERVKWESSVPTFSLGKEELRKYRNWKPVKAYLGLPGGGK